VRFVVTGASGHLGANVVRALVATGEPVRAVDIRPGDALAGIDAEFVRGDVLDPATLKDAFAGAEFLAQEYSDKSPVYTIIGYGFAVTTGVFRMYNRDHWFSDVVAGAGFGILSTKAAYLIYPYLRNALTHTDQKTGKSTAIMPIYQNGMIGLSFAMEL